MLIAPNTAHMRQFLAEVKTAMEIYSRETRRSEIKRIVEKFIIDPRTTLEEKIYIAQAWGETMKTFVRMIQKGEL